MARYQPMPFMPRRNGVTGFDQVMAWYSGVNGDSLMQWALWAVAERNHLPVYGYEPGGDDQAKAERVADMIDRY